MQETDTSEGVEHEAASAKSVFSYRSEVKLLTKLGMPAACLFALRTAQLLTDQAVLGHLAEPPDLPPAVYLDAASQALLWMNLTVGMVVRGVGGALSTLTSNAIGAGNDKLARHWLKLGLGVTTVAALVVAVLWEFAVPPLAAWLNLQKSENGSGPGYEDTTKVAELSVRYSRLSAAWLLPTFWMEAINSWLIAQEIIFPQLAVYSGFFLINLGLNMLLVYGLPGANLDGLGFDGSPLATFITRLSQVAALVLVVRFSGHRFGGKRAVLPSCSSSQACSQNQLRVFLSQALPRCLSSGLEELCLATVGVEAAKLGAAPMAAHSAILSVFFWLTSPMYGLTNAAVVRIGYHLGSGNPAAAKRVAWLISGIAYLVSFVVAIVLVLGHNVLGLVLTQSSPVVHLVSRILPLTAAAYSLIGGFYAAMAVLNGQGRPAPVAVSFLFGCFVIAPVLGYVLAYQLGCCGGVRLMGLWIGLIVGYGVTTLISFGAVFRSDWPELARQAKARSKFKSRVADTAPGNTAAGSVPERGGLAEPSASAADIASPAHSSPSQLAALSTPAQIPSQIPFGVAAGDAEVASSGSPREGDSAATGGRESISSLARRGRHSSLAAPLLDARHD